MSRPRHPFDAEDRLRKARRAYGYRWSDLLRSFEAYRSAFDVEDLRYELDQMRYILGEVEKEIDRRDTDLRRREKVRQLREGVSGRTDAEIETARRLADRLEARQA